MIKLVNLDLHLYFTLDAEEFNFSFVQKKFSAKWLSLAFYFFIVIYFPVTDTFNKALNLESKDWGAENKNTMNQQDKSNGRAFPKTGVYVTPPKKYGVPGNMYVFMYYHFFWYILCF